MKIQSVFVDNFGSYKKLEFYFKEGLTLISGPTGVGKSTLFDTVTWGLFGRTAKDGTSDEVLSWGESTITEVVVDLGDGKRVHRIRGRKPGDNDLFFTNSDSSPIRGKDLKDTQLRINELLGFDYETFVLGCYFHEFSQSSQFFSTTAKNRRDLIDNIVDLSMSNKLADSIKASIKTTKEPINALEFNIGIKKSASQMLLKLIKDLDFKISQWRRINQAEWDHAKKKASEFEANQETIILDLENKIQTFNKQHFVEVRELTDKIEDMELRAKSSKYHDRVIEDLIKLITKCANDVCPVCLSEKGSAKRLSLTEELHDIKTQKADNLRLLADIQAMHKDYDKLLIINNPYRRALELEITRENTHKAEVAKLEAKINPYVEDLAEKIREHKQVIAEGKELTKQLNNAKVELADLELLSEINTEFRTQLVKSVIRDLETESNRLLSHFDSEFRVGFTMEGDKLEVDITKDGNTASYKQLSKGQRQMLKLVFGVSVMKAVSNHYGVAFNTLFFDESLDGMDEVTKAKAFKIFSELNLQYPLIYVTDHSEGLKVLFDRRYDVEMTGGKSEIKCQN